MKKKIDERLKILIENGVKVNHRGFIIIVGDRGRDQVANIYQMLIKCRVRAKPSVLWCYKKELGFSSHKEKRMKQIKKLKHSGLYNQEVDDPFEAFVGATDIRYTYYKDSHKVLGQTFGMLVL